MYIRKEIREFMNKMPKEMKLPRHWRKFVNENSKEYNLLIKHGSEYECTNCGKYFYSEQVPGRGCWDICPFCGEQYDVRRSNLKHYFFLYDLAYIDNVDNKLILRYFEVRRSYNHTIRRFTDNVVEYARIIPELGIELVNDRFVKYMAMEKVYHTSKIEKWRIFNGMYGLSQYYKSVYLDNISEKVKGTQYEYSQLKEAIEYKQNKKEKKLKEIFSRQDKVLEILKKAEIPSFELLMKAGLYELALDNPQQFNIKGNFEKRFGIGKEYYSFMKKHNITTDELNILIEIKRKNINIIRSILQLGDIEDIEKVSKYVKLEQLLEYTKKQKNFSLPSYLDYIRSLQKLDVPIKGKKILYPKVFTEAHDETIRKLKIIINDSKKLNKKIEQRYNELQKNCYTNEEFFIRPAKSLKDLKDEAKQQNNCVYRNYSEDYAFGDTDIYFFRRKAEPNKSVVTIEVKDKKIRQKEQKNHQKLSMQQSNILDFWENNVLNKAA